MSKPHKKILISIIISLIVFSLVILFIIIPWVKEVETISADFIKEKQKIASLEEVIKNIDRLEVDLIKIEKGNNFYNKTFLEEGDPIKFITYLESITEGLEANLNSLAISKAEKDASIFDPLYFQLSVSGSYDNLARFLEKFESSNWLLKIKDINISKSGSGEENEIRAELSFYVYRENK